MKNGPKRDWAERAAGQQLRRLENGLAAVHWNQGGDVAFITELARALRRAEKRGYERGCKAEETYEQKNLPSGIQMGGAG